MAVQENPYLPPSSRVADAIAPDGNYIEGGRAVPVGHSASWIGSGWRIFRRQIGVWILLAIVFGLILLALFVVPILGQFAVTLLMPVFVAGMMAGSRKVEAGEDLELADLFAGFRRNTGALLMVGVIGLGLTMAVLIPAMLLTGAGAVLTAMVGGTPEAAGAGVLVGFLVFFALVIPINMAIWFAPALVMFHEQPAPRAMLQSFRGCLKNLVPFLLYGVILFVLAIFASIPFGLGWFALGPVIAGSVYAAYRDIYTGR
jgi:uncharacterized membrane protein